MIMIIRKIIIIIIPCLDVVEEPHRVEDNNDDNDKDNNNDDNNDNKKDNNDYNFTSRCSGGTSWG